MEYIYRSGMSSVAVIKEADLVSKVFIDGEEHQFENENDPGKAEFADKTKRNKYGNFLSKQFENLIVLTGAGSSSGIGEDVVTDSERIERKGRLLSELWDDVSALLTDEVLKRFCQLVHYNDKSSDEYVKNLEKLMSCANTAKEFVKDEQIGVGEIIVQIEHLIRDKCELILPSNSPHALLLERIAKRKVTLPRAKVFTLNYDTLFEQAARKNAFTVIDGFSFSTPRVFSGNNFDHDIVMRDKRGVKEEDNFIKKVIHLYKPHGSVDWFKSSDGMIIQGKSDEKPLMIFPKDSKYENSYEQPFFEMMSRFQQNLRSENVLLITIGFSFADKHIIAMIKEALIQNASFQLMVVNKGIDNSESVRWLYDLAGLHSNIVLVDELFVDFAINYPELKSYNQEEGNKIIIVSNQIND